ncbi:MAG TPA: NUDIX domain-containing protein [Acidimicrobiales bacterium]|jgi:isopentenyldiphosphate isomerase
MTAGDELVEVVDEAGTVLRLATRAEMRAGNLRHRGVAVVVLTRAGELVAHRRADWKDVWPGRWDVCFGGVAQVGEDWVTAARRELAEEAGVDVPASALRLLGSDSYQDDAVCWFGPIYAVTHDGPFRPADGEVAELVLVPLAGLEDWLVGRQLTDDSAAMVVPRLRELARGDSPGSPH